MQHVGVEAHLDFLEEPIPTVVPRFTHKDVLVINILRCHLDVVHQGQYIAFSNYLQHEEYDDIRKSSVHSSPSQNTLNCQLICIPLHHHRHISQYT